MSSNGDTSFDAAAGKSTTTFLSALVVAGAVAGAQFIAFIFLRTSMRKVYSPRTYLPIPSRRTPPASLTPWGWIIPTIRSPSRDIIERNGLDAYMFLRYLKLCIFIFGPVMLLTWAVLLPVDAAGTDVSAQGLNAFTFGNIPSNKQSRYWAHLVCAYAVCFWVFFLVHRELDLFVRLRHAYLVSKTHLSHPQARTVLVTGVPKEYLDRRSIIRLCSRLPGGVRQIWISRALGQLPELYEERLNLTGKLENAETKLCRTATKLHSKEEKKRAKLGASAAGKNGAIDKVQTKESTLEASPLHVDRLVPQSKRPTHKLGFLGLFGRKVDTISHCKEEIVRLTKELEEGRAKVDDHPPHNSIFIEFNEQMAAHLFAQGVVHHRPLRMASKYIDVAPGDLYWNSLNHNPYDLRFRNIVAWGLTLGLIILWSFPVAFVGIVSNLSSLCSKVSWLAWLCRAPGIVEDVIQGVLPPVLLLLLFVLLPIFLRLIGKYSGIPRHSDVELSLMSRYYLFLVVHGFLVTTLTSGLTAAIPQIISNPGETVTILTQNLPKASIFFETYVVTNCLVGAAGTFLQVIHLFLYLLRLHVLSSTPRQEFNARYKMPDVMWGTIFPNTTLLTTISLAYAIIAPIMSGLALLGFACFWLAYKYVFMYVIELPRARETGGLFFIKAIGQLFTGLYISQICLQVPNPEHHVPRLIAVDRLGLFFLARNDRGRVSSIPQGALMVVLILITAAVHRTLYHSYKPVTKYLPLSLDDKRETDYGKNGADGDEVMQDLEHPGSDDDMAGEREANAEGTTTARGEKKAKRRTKATSRERKRTTTADDTQATGDTEMERDRDREQPDRFAFLHPATWEHTRPIWIPDDVLGVGKAEVEDLKHMEIPASTAGAGMSARGHVWVSKSPPENVEVIEMPRPEREGIFALPGAVGAGARRAARRLEDVRIDDRVKGAGTHLRTRTQRLGRSGTANKSKPPRVKLSDRLGRTHGSGSRTSTAPSSDSEGELQQTKTAETHDSTVAASPSLRGGGRGSGEEAFTDAEEGQVSHDVAAGADLPGQEDSGLPRTGRH